MLPGLNPMLSTDPSVAWAFLIYVCTLVTELMARKNRPLIPAPSTSVWPSERGSPEYSY
jgi:hypothetical protein